MKESHANNLNPLRKKKAHNLPSPGRLMIASFLVVISIGTALLSMPFAHTGTLSILDAFFMATSSTCVTGLYVVPMSSFTLAGQSIILGLIQIGGLGLMTLSFFLASFFLGSLGVAARSMASEVLSFQRLGRIKSFLILICTTTLVIESIGTVCLFFHFKNIFPAGKALFYAAFCSISAFCNAGMTLADNNLIGEVQSPILLTTLGALVFAGGLGFAVWYDLLEYFFGQKEPNQPEGRRLRLSLHSRIVIKTSLFLVLFGTLVIWGLEYNKTFADLSPMTALFQSWFLSVSLRSAGFFTQTISTFAQPTIFLFAILMAIGASPGSTGGGIKTTTLALFLATLSSIMKRKNVVEIHGRTIPQDQLNKAIAIMALSVFWIMLAMFVLLISETAPSFLDTAFEVISAFSTTGLSRGLTENLSIIGKIVIISTMIVGRIGSLTLIFSLRKKREKQLYRYPEERVLIG